MFQYNTHKVEDIITQDYNLGSNWHSYTVDSL